MKGEKLPDVSILIPIYNAYEYISETLNSCLNQTCNAIEIIVVDDHSTDNSYEIVNEFQFKYPGIIKLYTNPGKGACAARNYAFMKSSGAFIQYLDADDLISPNKIESQVEILRINTNLYISSCKWGRFINNPDFVKWENQEINKDYSKPIDILIDCWNGKGMVPIHSWLTPRKLIRKAGGWNENLLINQDGEFFSRVLFFADKIKFSSQAEVYYRSGNSSSISQAYNMTYPKAASLLESYKLYQLTWQGNIEESKLSMALAQNYLNFIYTYYPLHKDLILEAETCFRSLGYVKMWPSGGENFKLLAKLIGFKNALKIRSKNNPLSRA